MPALRKAAKIVLDNRASLGTIMRFFGGGGGRLTEIETPRPEDGPFFEPDSSNDSELSFPREGLPRDYRMRHDHYVDELIAAGRMPPLRLVPVSKIESSLPSGAEGLEGLVDSIQEFGVLQPLLVRRDRGKFELLSGAKRLAAATTAGLSEVPCLVLEVDEIEARRLAEAANRGASRRSPAPLSKPMLSASAASTIEGGLNAILSALGLLERPENSLRDQVALGLIRCEALRASRLLQGLRLLAADRPVIRRSLDFGALLRDALSESEEERAFLAVALDLSIQEPCSIRADRELLSMAVAGAIETVISLLRKSRGATLLVHLAGNPAARTATLRVSQDAVRMPTSSWSLWFDSGWEDRPGGETAAIPLLAAKRATELHGGRLEVAPTETGGVRIRLGLPES
jgi:ParB-like chromosome segregation protein Spo0J